MFCTVYQLYRDGVRLPREEIKAGGVTGWLTLGNRGPMSPSHVLYARLFPVDGERRQELDELIPVLAGPKIKLIKGGGMLLTGSEDRLYWQPLARQSWWVVPMPAGPGAGGA